MNVNTANLCLSCDTLFEGEECAKCGDRMFKPLRDWLTPLVSFDDVKEAYNIEKNKKENKIQAGRSGNTHSIGLYYDRLTKPRTRVGCKESINKDDTATVDKDNKKTPYELEVSSCYHRSGEQQESERNIKVRGSGIDAGHTPLGKVLCWCEQIGTLFSRKEHRGGM